MADSTDLKSIKQIVDIYDKKLLATDKRFRNSVKIIHEDGTSLFFDSAFLMKRTVKVPLKELSRGPYPDVYTWIIVFSEHHGTHIYCSEDLKWYGQFKRNYEELKEIK